MSAEKYFVFFQTPVSTSKTNAVHLGYIVGDSGEFDTEQEARAFADARFADAKDKGANRAQIQHGSRIFTAIEED